MGDDPEPLPEFESRPDPAADLTALASFGTDFDFAAYEHLVQSYQGLVYGVCRRLLGTLVDADEATHETFLKLSVAAGRIDRCPAAWIYRAALGLCRRWEEVRPASHLREPLHEDTRVSSGVPEWDDVRPQIDRVLEDLADEDLELVLQCLVLQRAPRVVAPSLGLDRPTLERDLAAVCGNLRTALQEQNVVVTEASLQQFLRQQGAPTAVPPALTTDLLAVVEPPPAASQVPPPLPNPVGFLRRHPRTVALLVVLAVVLLTLLVSILVLWRRRPG